MSTKLNLYTDIGGRAVYAPAPSTNIFTATLVNGSAQTITLPASKKIWTVSFSYQPGSSVWVDFSGATAASPAGSTFAASTSELNPGARTLYTFKNDGITQNTISLLTTNATTGVSVALYEGADNAF
jgi:hypothetical protein